jgi:enoyl-CoA hydratase/carnithine racemase
MASSRQPADISQALKELVELNGAGLLVIPLTATKRVTPAASETGVITLGVDVEGLLPDVATESFDILLTSAASAPSPWVSVAPNALHATITDLQRVVDQQPVAAAVVAQVLRMTLALNFDAALLLESLAYSMLQASGPFRAWRAQTPVRTSRVTDDSRVQLTRAGNVLNVRLDRAHARNAVDSRMRDSLVEALELAIADPDTPLVIINGAGPAFCAGGDLNEFGRADDPGVSHLMRTFRSPVKLVHRIRERVHVHVHGACIGAGIEMSAAAAHVSASSDAFFRLPEVAMGLMPGAGGTASIARRIGRHRACFMSLSGRDIDARLALSWRLIDVITPGAHR